jgi:Circularly permutated YpsA SLOG family
MKLLSGGQSGVDRAVLDVALARGIAYGGWCARGPMVPWWVAFPTDGSPTLARLRGRRWAGASRNLSPSLYLSPMSGEPLQLQCPSHGALVGYSRPSSRHAAAAGATSDARGASAQPLLDLGLLRKMFAPRANGAGAANNSMGRRDIE